MVEIVRLTEASEAVLSDVNELIHQLSERLPECSIDLLRKIISDPNYELWIAKGGDHIIGMATLAIVVIPEGERGQIEDVVVHEQFRGKGIGEALSKKLIERAKARQLASIALSSREERVAANKLYQKLGFEKRETNTYVMKL